MSTGPLDALEEGGRVVVDTSAGAVVVTKQGTGVRLAPCLPACLPVLPVYMSIHLSMK